MGGHVARTWLTGYAYRFSCKTWKPSGRRGIY